MSAERGDGYRDVLQLLLTLLSRDDDFLHACGAAVGLQRFSGRTLGKQQQHPSEHYATRHPTTPLSAGQE